MKFQPDDQAEAIISRDEETGGKQFEVLEFWPAMLCLIPAPVEGMWPLANYGALLHLQCPQVGPIFRTFV